MAQLTPIDLGQFRGLFYDLDEIGLALPEPDHEAVGLARKALGRLVEFLKIQAPESTLGMQSNINCIEKNLAKCDRKSLFGPPPNLAPARESHQRLRAYIEGLEMAWKRCRLAPGQADQAAFRCLAR